MSFAKMDVEDLRRMATEEFGIELPEGATQEAISHALVEKGITWEMAVQFDSVAADIDAAAKPEEEGAQPEEKPKAKRGRPATKEAEAVQVDLLRMMRENRRYDVRGYTFTHDNPFGLVETEAAAWIVENVEGFRYATPKEAKEFYG